jgi:hypothetical protein
MDTSVPTGHQESEGADQEHEESNLPETKAHNEQQGEELETTQTEDLP